jgi:phenylalanyl-tRNA synthetase beta chain
VVASDVSADKIVTAAKGADKVLVKDVSVFDIFIGPSVGEGRKSVAVEVMLQPRDHTLTEEEIGKVSAAIVTAVRSATGGELRA